ncbi:MAG TPA: secretin N-terminal domain-containing protein [Candidatus Paceibacterota bacterium]|nr:secretin N-terminal domain-containing protein [Candidatus Paceibacterota bacterium]
MNKIKLFATVLLAGFVLLQNALSQPGAAETSQPPDTISATNGDVYAAMVSNVMEMSTGAVAATTVVTNQTVAATASNEPSADTAASNPPMPSAVSNEPSSGTTGSNVMIAAVASNATAQVEETNSPAAAEADTSNVSAGTTEPNQPVESEIRFQEIPITSVIENLARQAGINYLLDPKIGYGLPDQNGTIKPEPSLSLRWENVTPEQALLAVLDNYGLQMIMDPKTKIAKITVKDPTAPIPLSTHVYQLAYASVSNMVVNVETAFTDPRSKVVPDERTSELIVVATDKEQTDVAALIAKLDKPTRQVLIETRLIEISSNPSTSKGVDWTGTLQAQNISFGNGVLNANSASKSETTIGGAPVTTTTTYPSGRQTTTTTTPASSATTTLDSEPQNSSNPGGFMYNTLTGITPSIGFLNADGVKATLSFLNQSSDAQVVSTPRIVTLDNEKATISVTRAFPIFATTAGTQGSPGGSSVTYSNVGIILQVTPHISANDYIWMKVLPQVTSYYATVTKTIAGQVNQADEFDSRVIDTQVLIPNANTLVMGGMVKDNPTAAYTKVPILGDIPNLGLAFRSETKTMDKQNLLIFITPTIVKDSDFQPTATDFMNSRPIKEKEPLDPNSAWDSGKPRDWSNPKNTDPTQAIINQKTTD